MNVLLLGGSKNIGYYAAKRLLASGATITFLLRNAFCFDNDQDIKPYVASGKVKIVPGDALKEEDVKRAWTTASMDAPVDLLLFTVGKCGFPKFSITKGAVITPGNLCTASMLNVLSTMPLSESTPQPKIILVSSTGLTKDSHKTLPLPFKPMYAYLLAGPHADKLGMERVIFHAAGWTWPANEPEPKADILEPGWQKRLPGESGYLKSVLVLRPALFTDGECTGDAGKKKYRTADTELKGYTISRKDVAHFIVEDALKNWERWENKFARLAN